MEEEKYKIPEPDFELYDDSHLSLMGCVIRWVILLLVAIVIVVILAVFGSMLGNLLAIPS
jgi:hypothetical protein